MRQRTIVCPLIENEGHYLLCKMAADRGFFPGNGPYPAAAWSQGNVLKRRCGGKYAKSSAKNSSLPISRHGAFRDDTRVKTTPTGIRKRST